jgi:hypothetical protein
VPAAVQLLHLEQQIVQLSIEGPPSIWAAVSTIMRIRRLSRVANPSTFPIAAGVSAVRSASKTLSERCSCAIATLPSQASTPAKAAGHMHRRAIR